MTLPSALRTELIGRRYIDGTEEPQLQSDGLTNEVWRVGRVGVKLFRSAETSPLFPNAPVAEWDALHRFAPTGIAPTPLDLFTHRGQAVLVYEWANADGGEVSAKSLGAILSRVHRPADVGDVGRDPHADGTAILKECADQSLWQLAPERVVISSPAVQLHGDPVPGNTVQTSSGLQLIDWQAANCGTAWHDIAIAVSPAMRIVAGLQPWTEAERRDLIRTAGLDPETWHDLAPAYHWRMACHCQWRIERGHAAYQAGLVAEIRAALRSTNQVA
ncbi:phosphotransferase [Pontivivens insulae]|uniref:Aminoglycoside phosphotransferase domain-containing protein n=1 Tax=Pontivivens insulae TaxID=1639689 RepID=A0A2R8A896_9RHOB|nr:phosphotransferase [Pontivivens insulae]RED18555.1 phosphotransferase family enzyme [Pontivivens insulae]SPF28453.1 hypothetical protein POI8812_00753 [Pontivivens insulae]